MDSPSHGVDQRDEHPLFDRHRRRPTHRARRAGDCRPPPIARGARAGSTGRPAPSFRRPKRKLQQRAREAYRHRLAVGVAREQARKEFPLSTYTEAYWKSDLHNLLHFLRSCG